MNRIAIVLVFSLLATGCNKPEAEEPSNTSTTTAAPAVEASQSEWKSGWGQGVSEYWSEDTKGNQLYIACPSDDRPVSASATINGKEFDSGTPPGFDVIVDGELFQNPFDTDCRVCANNFIVFWEKLRNAKNIKLSADAGLVEIPAGKISQILPKYGTKENSCSVAF